MAIVFPSQIALVLFTLCFLTVASDVPVMKNIDINKMAGKWYPVRTATPESSPRPIHAFTLETTGSGGITMNIEIPQKGACTMKKVALTNVSPGVFTSPEGKATVMDTDYKSYFFAELSKDNTRILVLYARKKKVDKKVKKKFRGIVKNSGLKTAHRLKLRKEDMCS
ncbi:epididymal secretory protein 4-like [Anolis sagrei]|uniref:epididymal secretory protein 4-like n=1 Tax=Anolis sagrei TaxID=38937 RepID=UPI003522A24D